jgi:bacitracin transport system ATP-binding protein
MTVRKGDIYGFLGQNGAGKTTTIRMLMNYIKPTSGSC